MGDDNLQEVKRYNYKFAVQILSWEFNGTLAMPPSQKIGP